MQRWLHLQWVGQHQPRQKWTRDTPLFKTAQADAVQVGIVGGPRGKGGEEIGVCGGQGELGTRSGVVGRQ